MPAAELFPELLFPLGKCSLWIVMSIMHQNRMLAFILLITVVVYIWRSLLRDGSLKWPVRSQCEGLLAKI